MHIFGFDIEFDHQQLCSKIDASRGNSDCKGYICVVDGPSLARSRTNSEFMQLLQQSYANTCDGSSIATVATLLHGRQLSCFTGPEIFSEYITRTEFSQVLLGNTPEMFEKVRTYIASHGTTTDHLHYIPLPFATLDDFDYEGIARQLSDVHADIIWVSLGAPKQEFFMQRLLPHIQRGVMLGVGAAFAFYIGELKDFAFRIGHFRLNWIYRIFIEPKKQLRRISTMLTTYPSLIISEYRTLHKRSKQHQ